MLFASTLVCSAATLHGRVKDQRCAVLPQMQVRIRATSPQQGLERSASTDDAGNYTVDLPPGEYQVCVQRDAHASPTCTGIAISARGDTWITTQLRDTAPDLSNFGNRWY
ncbi:carboxypeptidase-like regulatory domain-containing protein [Terriglobus aquaticus]|uniref:Carboxypeptidase-like regulatory domain-containing protein n=1 Tax=Terriglobus aquaticus TaxID=940139 RepID=A0ABW9KRB1_9BACT|nr:carboxypeptidase-like regulatory domain-containing protein [Terriglobus aquaticus]